MPIQQTQNLAANVGTAAVYILNYLAVMFSVSVLGLYSVSELTGIPLIKSQVVQANKTIYVEVPTTVYIPLPPLPKKLKPGEKWHPFQTAKAFEKSLPGTLNKPRTKRPPNRRNYDDHDDLHRWMMDSLPLSDQHSDDYFDRLPYPRFRRAF